MRSIDRERTDRLLTSLTARAAGMWRVDGSELIQTAFASAADMPVEIADGFAGGTTRVPLDRLDLGIVKAALSGRVAISRVRELPAEIGSGYWLRAFNAERSVATPLTDDSGRVVAVFSVAVPADPRSDEEIAALAREIGCTDAGRDATAREQ